MDVDTGGFVVAAISLGLSVVFTMWFTRLQTTAVRKQADAAEQQVAVARDQAISARDAAETAQRQLALAEQIRREQVEPYVVVDIRPSDHVSHIFMLVIENIGPTVARNVRIQFTPQLERAGESDPSRNWKPIRESRLLTNGIPMMPPGRHMEWFFDIASERFASGLPMQYTVTVNADGPIDRVETLTYRIDLSVHGGINRLGVKGLHEGVKAVEKLVAATDKVADRLTRPLRLRPSEETGTSDQGDG